MLSHIYVALTGVQVSFSKFNTHIFHRQVPRAPSLSIDVCRNQRLGGPGLSLVDLVLTSHVSTPQVLAPKEAEHLIESENVNTFTAFEKILSSANLLS